MDVIDYEIEEINKIVERVICSSKLIACIRSLIRINIKQTESRQITVCIRFPSNYPSEHLLVELKSPTISGKILDGLTTLAEQKASEFLGKPQTLHTLKFIDNYLQENPLCIAYDEIFAVKQLLRRKNDLGSCGGELKCLQKTSNVSLVVNESDYFFKAKYHVPEEYPTKCIEFIEHKSNFPDALLRFLTGQAKEIARKCVEPSLRANIKSDFVVKPSLLPSLRFLIEAISDFTSELCPVCNFKCLPAKAADVELRDTADLYAERVYCGHIYHLGCLKKYMREPPFPLGGKTCPAKKPHPRSDSNKGTKDSNGTQPIKNRKPNQLTDENICGLRISHDRWALNVKLAEARWAQQQARERELEEVKDFLQ